MNSAHADSVSDILDFWFSDHVRKKWFEADREFDAELKERFGALSAKAVAGDLEAWRQTADGVVALIVLLDQIPRNTDRGTPLAFRGDAHALEIARDTVARGDDKALPKAHRQMLYMPFMHAEDLAAQEEGVRLFQELGDDSSLDYMKQHRDIIARFGRFPHRNAVLGRQSTDEELEFLKQPGSSF
jgi:uncharacterized protein (DUF924 family)